MTRFLGAAVLFGTILAAVPARAQVAGGGASPYYGPNSAYGAPGNYGMAWGYSSYGVPRTYTSFSSPGPGYAYGYQPYGLAPVRYGVGLWRPGFATPGYIYGTGYYQTFPVPFRAVPFGSTPPVGMYAPGFGAPSTYGW